MNFGEAKNHNLMANPRYQGNARVIAQVEGVNPMPNLTYQSKGSLGGTKAMTATHNLEDNNWHKQQSLAQGIYHIKNVRRKYEKFTMGCFL